MFSKFAALVVASSAWLAGCASPSGPISLSISELGSEVQEDAGSLIQGIRHRRSHNVTGMGSSETVGTLSVDPDPPMIFQWPSLFSRKTLPDQLAPRINSACSRVAVHDLPMAAGKGMDEVLKLRDSLDALHGAEVELQRSRAIALLLAELVATYAAAPANGGAASAAPAPDRTSTQRALLVNAWRGLTRGDDPPADAEGWKAKQDAFAPIHARIEADMEAALTRFRSARKEQGLIVARWEYEARQEGGLAAIGLNVEGRQTQTRSGFVVMGSPRTLTLISGDDLMARACSAEDAKCSGVDVGKRSGIDSMFPARRLYTTTFQLLARHLAWAENGSAERQLALKVQLSEIMKAASASGLDSLKAKLDALKIDMGHASSTLTSGENLGAVSGAVNWEVPFTFWRDEAYARSVAYLRALNGDFLRVSSMRSTLDAYASKYGGNLPPESAKNCENNGPNMADVERVTSVHLACERLRQPEFVKALDASDLALRQERCATVGLPPAPAARTAAVESAP